MPQPQWRWRQESCAQCDPAETRLAAPRLEVISRRARINATHELLARARKSVGAYLYSGAPGV